jgi:hypothetical protein
MVGTPMQLQPGRSVRIDGLQEAQECLVAMPRLMLPDYLLPVATFSAANRQVVLCRM